MLELDPSRVEAPEVRHAPEGDASTGHEIPALLALLAFAMLVALYFVARLGGRWAENDSAYMTRVIQAIAATGTLAPTTGTVYPQGYSYAAVSSFLLAATGVDVSTLQQVIYPLVSAFLVVPAWALYRELTGSRRAATVATLLLFVQPEFLFVVLRSSHERMLRAEMIICLWLLVRSFRHREHTATLAAHVVLFYLAAYALIATNVLFGVSFFAAIATVCAVCWLLSRLRPGMHPRLDAAASRLLSVTSIASGLGFVFVFYVYPPSASSLQVVGELGQTLVRLFLSARTGTDQFTLVSESWVSVPVYFALGSGDYLLLLLSLATWLRQGVRWLGGRETNESNSLGLRLLWLFYAAFVVQGFLAVIADRVDFLGGNLELRVFPSFVLVAVPLVAVPLSRWRPSPPAAGLAGVLLAVLAGVALLKATDEPVLSNKWLFYTGLEVQALAWADHHERAASIWTGLDERLRSAYAMTAGDSTEGNRWDAFSPKAESRVFVISNVTRLQSARLRQPLPEVAAENRVYDAGQVQIYRLRPRTPYQK